MLKDPTASARYRAPDAGHRRLVKEIVQQLHNSTALTLHFRALKNETLTGWWLEVLLPVEIRHLLGDLEGEGFIEGTAVAIGRAHLKGVDAQGELLRQIGALKMAGIAGQHPILEGLG